MAALPLRRRRTIGAVCCPLERQGLIMDESMVMQVGHVEDEMHGKYLTFIVESGTYGVEIKYITEIISVQAVTPVPNTHNYLKGIINLRGTVVPVIDMRLRFGLPEIEYTDRTCIVVVSMEEMTNGLIVDEVQEVVDIDDEHIQPPRKVSGAHGNAGNYFIRAIGSVGNEVKQLLDIEKVFGTGAMPLELE